VAPSSNRISVIVPLAGAGSFHVDLVGRDLDDGVAVLEPRHRPSTDHSRIVASVTDSPPVG